MVTDKEFLDMFEIWSGKNSQKPTIRYIFRKLHKHLDKLHEINIDNTEVHIEHVLPQDPKNWTISAEDHEAYLWRLGNLALLSGKLNRAISNKPFKEKKFEYAKSIIRPSSDLSKYDDWSIIEIEERQKILAQYALTIWKK